MKEPYEEISSNFLPLQQGSDLKSHESKVFTLTFDDYLANRFLRPIQTSSGRIHHEFEVEEAS